MKHSEETPDLRSDARRRGLLGIKIASSLLLFGFVLWWSDGWGALKRLRHLSWGGFLLANVFFVGATWATSLRLRCFFPRLSVWSLLRVHYIARFYAQILPGQIAGEAVKMVLLRKEEPRFERLVSVVLVDKWIGLCALLFLGCAGLWWSRPTIPFGIYVSMVVGVVLLSCSLFFFRSARVLRVFLAWMDWCKEHCWGGPLFGRLAQFASAWNEILQDLRLLGKSLLWGAVYHMLAGLFLMVLASACGLWLPWVDWLWIFSVLSLVLLLPISVGGIGVREGTLVGVLHWLGIPATLSMSFAFALLSLTLFHALLGGLWMQAGSLRKP